MPLEHRKIDFSNAELQAAMVSYCLRHSIHLPDAFIAGIDLQWQPKLEATFRFSDFDDSNRAIILNEPEIAASLIEYCHAQNMPLPHHADKVLEPSDRDGVAMLIRMSWGDLRRMKNNSVKASNA